MARPRIIDTFMFNNELDMLDCRLYELHDAVDAFVLVESERDHQDHRKPLWFAEHAERFAAYRDKIVHVVVSDGLLPSKRNDPDPWARELSQREFIAHGLRRLAVDDHDIVLQSDVDEIPRPLQTRNVRPKGFWRFAQRGHFWAVDWLYPQPWYGTVAGTAAHIATMPSGSQFAYMRHVRTSAVCPPHLTDAGWHLSWLGGVDAALRKVGSFCHPEVEQQIRTGLEQDRFLRDGYHVDGLKMQPVDVDDSWPRWIVEGHAPAAWYRPR